MRAYLTMAAMFFCVACGSITFDGPTEIVLNNGAVINCPNGILTAGNKVFCRSQNAGTLHHRFASIAEIDNSIVKEIRHVNPEAE